MAADKVGLPVGGTVRAPVNMKTAAIIPARGGSKGIPRKNLKDFCGRPLIAWSISQAKRAHGISSVWVTSDDQEILAAAESWGARAILRPKDLSGDTATSEAAWLHALHVIESGMGQLDAVVGMQCTSPLREASDLDDGLRIFSEKGFDSVFSGALIGDFYIWQKDRAGSLESLNYDWKNRKRRQDFAEQYVENGSFYVFRPDIIRNNNNRLGGRIGVAPMAFWKSFELDTLENWTMCEHLMKGFGLDKSV